MTVTSIIITSLIIMVASLLGVIFTWGNFGVYIKKNNGLLVSFSAGVFLIVVVGLAREVIGHASDVALPILWIALGSLVAMVTFRIFSHFHHHHDDHHEDEEHSRIDARRILLSDALHNIGDGVLIAASFSVSTSVGIAAAVSIFVHELVQEISEFFVLKSSGHTTQQALSYNFMVSSTILIGALGGYFLIDTFAMLEMPLLALSAGAFLVVVFQDLIPESVRHSKKEKNYWKHVVFFALGLTLMLVINQTLSGGHTHGVVHQHDHEEAHSHHRKNDGHDHGSDDHHEGADEHEHNNSKDGHDGHPEEIAEAHTEEHHVKHGHEHHH